MSQEHELDVDLVFPPFGAGSGMRLTPEAQKKDAPPAPPKRTLPPPPPLPGAASALERIQEDVDLVIEATSRRLDQMALRTEEFERTVRGVLGAQERRVRELERDLEDTRGLLRESRRRVAQLAADVDRYETRHHELLARNAVAMARVEALERARVMGAELSRLASDSVSVDVDAREPTTKILRS